jgi:hypothetical protein
VISSQDICVGSFIIGFRQLLPPPLPPQIALELLATNLLPLGTFVGEIGCDNSQNRNAVSCGKADKADDIART